MRVVVHCGPQTRSVSSQPSEFRSQILPAWKLALDRLCSSLTLANVPVVFAASTNEAWACVYSPLCWEAGGGRGEEDDGKTLPMSAVRPEWGQLTEFANHDTARSVFGSRHN